MIAFEGEIVRVLPEGRRRVRLENGHDITALPPLGSAPGTTGLQDRVTVELNFNQLKGWRLARRP